MIEATSDAEPGAATDGDPQLGPVHDTAAGRALVSFVVVVLMMAVVSWNLPSGEVRDDLRDGFRPLVRTLGLDQSWTLFSPDPSRTSVDMYAEVHLDDGRVIVDRFPGGDPFFGALREYRWRKLERRVRDDGYRRLWEPTATWFAAQAATSGAAVVKVVLVRRLSTTPEPGSAEQRVWTEEEFFEIEFDPPVDGESP